MRVSRYSTGESFLPRAESLLLQAEAENNLILGIAGSWHDCSSDLTDRPYLAAVEQRGTVVACALKTPPCNVVITRAKDNRVHRSKRGCVGGSTSWIRCRRLTLVLVDFVELPKKTWIP